MDQTSRLLRALIVRGFILERSVWSWVMVVGALSRASAYWIRPAGASSPTSARIEGALSYPTWTVVLVFFATLIAVGTAFRLPNVAWLGHLIGIGVTSTLALSILSAAVWDGASWSAFWPLVVVGLVHFGRLNALGPRVSVPKGKSKKRAEPRRA